MGWISKLFKVASKEEVGGLSLDHNCWNWAVGETRNLPKVLNALHCLVGEEADIFLEGCSAKGELKQFINKKAIPEKEHIARGTVWPKEQVIHLPATKENIKRLAKLTEHVSPMEVATHFHVYEEGKIILEWYDAFTNEMFVSKEIPEERVKEFAESIGVSYQDEGEQSGSVGPR